MMSRHFRISSELSGAISKRFPHTKSQLSVLGNMITFTWRAAALRSALIASKPHKALHKNYMHHYMRA